MHAGKLVFAQVMEFAPWYTFRRLVTKYRGNFQRPHIQLPGPVPMHQINAHQVVHAAVHWLPTSLATGASTESSLRR